MPRPARTRPPAARRSVQRRITLFAALCLAGLTLACSFRVAPGVNPGPADPVTADARSFYRAALAFDDEGRLTDALAACERAVQLAPENPAAWRLLGYLRLNASEYAASVAASETALDLSPNDPAIHANLSWAFAAQGDTDRAAYHAARVEQLAEGSPDALALRAELEERAGRSEAALELYFAAAQRGPDMPVLQMRYARALRSAGQTSRARDWLHAAIDRNPEALQLRIALADALFELADYPGAARHAEQVLEKKPNTPAALYIAGAAAYRLSDYVRAEQRLGQYLNTDETALDARLLFANALLYLERFGEAEANYRRLLADQPGRADAQFNLGVTLLRSGRTEEARPIFTGLCSAGDAAACPYANSAPGAARDGTSPPPITNPGN